MEFNIYTVILGIYTLHLELVRAQDPESASNWVVPNGDRPDFSSTFTQGTVLQVIWTPIKPGAFQPILSTLWVSTWDGRTTPFNQLLADTNHMGSFDWTIAIPTNILNQAAKYVLRMKDFNSEYNSSSEQYPSPGFIIVNGDAASPSKTDFATTITTTSMTSTTELTTTSTASTATHTAGGSELSGGAIAGISVGSVGSLLLLAGSAYLFYRRKKRNRKFLTESPIYHEVPMQQSPVRPGASTDHGHRGPVELEGTYKGRKWPVELES
ncbi:hypothetical protein NHQ30_011199 [Ciborinia camelliae]|nr:hypothetical protein NHQ30_011199 [Ciborinia camelliae]